MATACHRPAPSRTGGDVARMCRCLPECCAKWVSRSARASGTETRWPRKKHIQTATTDVSPSSVTWCADRTETALGVPRHVLERIGALIGDDAQIDWVESTVRYGRREEGDGLAGMLAIFGQRLLVVVTLQNVREHRWRGARDDDGAVDARLIRRSDLVRIEVPASRGYDNGPDAWSAESDGTWRYRTSIELVYRDGTRIELGGDQSGDVSTLLPSLRDDLLT